MAEEITRRHHLYESWLGTWQDSSEPAETERPVAGRRDARPARGLGRIGAAPTAAPAPAAAPMGVRETDNEEADPQGHADRATVTKGVSAKARLQELLQGRSAGALLLSLLVWAVALAPIFHIAATIDTFQWDFRVFYSAGLTVDSGYNPYDNVQRNAIFPVRGMEFLYPPLSLYLLKGFTALSFDTAYLVWLGIKLLALGLLLLLWHKRFERLSFNYPVVIFFLIAFSGTLYRDLAAGNIAIFEQLPLWLGFLFLIKRQYLLFGLCVAVTSQIKLQPVVFLGLLLIVEDKPRWRDLGLSLAAFLALGGLNYVLEPTLTSAFIERMMTGRGNLDEMGDINPSLLAFIRQWTEQFSFRVFALPPYASKIFYLIAAAGILCAFLYFFFGYRKRHPDYDRKLLVYAACLLYAVTAVRMKDYSYVICLLPTLALLRRRIANLALVPLVGILVVAPPLGSYVPYLGTLAGYFYAYLPLITAGVVLWLHLDEFREGASAEPAAPK